MADRSVSSSVLVVDDSLSGRQLASPFRRIAGFMVDVLVLLIPSIIAALAVATLALYWTHPGELRSVTALIFGQQGQIERTRLLGEVAPLLVRIEAQGLPPSVEVAVQNSDLKGAGEILSGYSFNFSLSPDERTKSVRPNGIRVEVGRLIPKIFRWITFFGVAAIYFVFFTVGQRKSTPGKRLMGTEVLKLDARPLTVWEAFERFGGYFAAAGTFGLGLLDLWRDPNRRLAHDRISHTVVVKRRPGKIVESSSEAPPSSGGSDVESPEREVQDSGEADPGQVRDEQGARRSVLVPEGHESSSNSNPE